MAIDLIIFDCDGVLIDSELVSARMLIATLAERGVDVDMDYVARHFLGRSYPIVLQQIRTEFGVALPDDFEDSYREKLLSQFRKELQVSPHVPEVVKALEIPFCLATSSSRPRVLASLDMVGLSDDFDGRIFTAAEVENGKPAPDLFLHVAQRMSVAPGKCLVIEDSRNGILAGRAAGMSVWWYNGGSHINPDDKNGPIVSLVDRTFDDFSEFFGMLSGIK